MKSQRLGLIIVIICVLLLGLMIHFIVQFNEQQLRACAEACGEAGADSCTTASCPYNKGGTLEWMPILSSIFIAALGGIGNISPVFKRRKDY